MYKVNTLEILFCDIMEKCDVYDKTDLKYFYNNYSHTYYELLYFLDGKGNINTYDKTLHISLYHLAIFPPSVSHKLFPDILYPGRHIRLGARIETEIDLNTVLYMNDKDGSFRWFFERIYNENKEKRDGYLELSNLYIKAVFLLIQRHFTDKSSEMKDIVMFCMKYINDHFMEEISVSKLASLCFVSTTYLTRIFHKKTGETPKNYINKVRIEEAKKLLVSTDMTIKEISDLIGFNNVSYFSTLFKNFMIVYPSKFRKQIR